MRVSDIGQAVPPHPTPENSRLGVGWDGSGSSWHPEGDLYLESMEKTSTARSESSVYVQWLFTTHTTKTELGCSSINYPVRETMITS